MRVSDISRRGHMRHGAESHATDVRSATHAALGYLAAASLALPMLVLCGCTTVRQDGTVVQHYVGYVRLLSRPSSDHPTIERINVVTTGAWLVPTVSAHGILPSVGVGYSHDTRELIPLDCRVVIRVQSEQQLRLAMTLLESSSLDGESLCVVQD